MPRCWNACHVTLRPVHTCNLQSVLGRFAPSRDTTTPLHHGALNYCVGLQSTSNAKVEEPSRVPQLSTGPRIVHDQHLCRRHGIRERFAPPKHHHFTKELACVVSILSAQLTRELVAQIREYLRTSMLPIMLPRTTPPKGLEITEGSRIY